MQLTYDMMNPTSLENLVGVPVTHLDQLQANSDWRSYSSNKFSWLEEFAEVSSDSGDGDCMVILVGMNHDEWLKARHLKQETCTTWEQGWQVRVLTANQ